LANEGGLFSVIRGRITRKWFFLNLENDTFELWIKFFWIMTDHDYVWFDSSGLLTARGHNRMVPRKIKD
jgi:hypothetical protein